MFGSTVPGMIQVRSLLARPWVIWGIFALVYVPSVQANLRGLGGPAGSADVLVPGASVGSQFAAAATFSVLQLAAAVGAAALLLLGPAWRCDPGGERVRRLGLRWTGGRALILGGAAGAAAGYVAILAGAAFVSALVLGALHLTGRPTAGGSIPDPLLLAGDYLMSVSAGIGEELLLLAIPYVLATRAGWKPWAVIALLTGLRLSIHLYYGAGSLFVVLWIPAAYLLYRATGSIAPLMLGHIVYDLLATTIQRSPALHTPALVVLAGLAVAGSALLAGSAARYLTTGRRSRPPLVR